MATTLGASVIYYNPGKLRDADLNQAVWTSQSVASGANTITITPPNTNKYGGYIRIICLVATLVVAADTGTLTIVPNTIDAVIAQTLTLFAITAALQGVQQVQPNLQWDFSCVSLAIALTPSSGGATLSVAYKLGY